MKDLLLALERAGQPRGGPGREPLAFALRDAQQAYLRAMLQMDEHDLAPAEAATLRRHADYLDLLGEEVGVDQAADAFFVAGTIYEWLARVGPARSTEMDLSSLTQGSVGDLIRASLCYSSGRHEASSALAAARALRVFEERHEQAGIWSAAARVVLQFLARDFARVLESHLAYGQAIQAVSRTGFSPQIDWARVGSLSRAAEGCAIASAGMLAGSGDLLMQADSLLAEAVNMTSAAGQPSLAALCGRLSRVVTGVGARSTYAVLERNGMAPDRVRWYGARIPELWTSQVEAIDGGLLSPDQSFVLSLPTGSGKTFLAQLSILATLDRDPSAWVAYLAPTRALVREVYRELGDALRPQHVHVQKMMASAELAIYSEDDELSIVTAGRTCAVLTPERMDLYLRANPEIAARLRLVIVDEAHQISEPGRGARLEALLGQLLAKWPQARIHLLSAFLPGGTFLTQWLGEDAKEYRSRTRPTRQLRGVCVRYGDNGLPDEWEVGRGTGRTRLAQPTPPQSWTRVFRSRRSYEVGALFASDPSHLLGSQTVAIPGLASGENWVMGRRDGRSERGNTGITDVVRQVATALARHPGMVLLFLPQTSWTQSVCRAVAEGLPELERLEPYARAVAASLGNDHPLAYSLRRGCAFHNARLPDEVLRVVEAAAQSQLLEVLCATSGLQAGVNLPASIVVVLGDPQAGDAPNPSVSAFANMAGRAGRPRYDTEGICLYVPPTITYRRGVDERARDYLLADDADLGVTSALGAEFEALMRNPEVADLADLSEPLQQILLGLWSGNVRSVADMHSFLDHTLGGVALASALDDRLAGALAKAAEAEGARFGQFARTALPYNTCVKIAELVPALEEAAAAEDWRESVSLQVSTVSRLLMTVPYFSGRVSSLFNQAPDPEVLAEIAANWVEGASYDDLAALLVSRTGGQYDGAKLVRIMASTSSLLGWGTGSLLSVASATEETTVQARALLPYYLRFGVDSDVAAYLRLIGVTDRLGARILAGSYPNPENASVTSVKSWSSSPQARAALYDYYRDNTVARQATEVDLGLADLPVVGTPLRVSLPPTMPPWIRPGFIAAALDVAGQWEIMDSTTGSRTVTAPLPSTGVVVPVSKSIDGVEAYLFPYRT